MAKKLTPNQTQIITALQSHPIIVKMTVTAVNNYVSMIDGVTRQRLSYATSFELNGQPVAADDVNALFHKGLIDNQAEPIIHPNDKPLGFTYISSKFILA